MRTTKRLETELEKRLDVAREAARQGRVLLLNYFGRLRHVKDKDQQGLVSEADLECEKLISEMIRKHFPKDIIVGEEESYEKKSKWKPTKAKGVRWLIDPLDGTTNYVFGFHVFCISIGVEVDGVMAVAVIDVPLLDRSYSAILGQGAYCDDRRIYVNTNSKLTESLLATGFSANADKAETLDKKIKSFGKVLKKVRGVRRAGSAAFDLCMVAEGIFAGYWEEDLSPWDTAAGVLLVTEAGGKVTRISGKSFSVYGDSMLATNGRIHRELQAAIHIT
jgi:myo-inositol-1(or 4)-monophosphatase